MTPIDPTVDLSGFANLLLKAAQDKNWALLVALALIAVVAAVRATLGKQVPFFKTDAGGALLVLAMGGLGGLATALLGGTPFTWGLVATMFAVSFKAAGGYSLARKLLAPLLPKLLQLLGVKADPVAAAEKAGEAAVADKPASGIDGLLK